MDLYNIIDCLNTVTKEGTYVLHKVSKSAPFSPAYTNYKYTLYCIKEDKSTEVFETNMTLRTVTELDTKHAIETIEREFVINMFEYLNNGK